MSIARMDSSSVTSETTQTPREEYTLFQCKEKSSNKSIITNLQHEGDDLE